MNAKRRREVEFHKMADSILVNESKCVDTKTLHHSVAPWYTTIRHSPHEHMRGFGMQVLEVPEIVMGALSLGNFSIWLRLDGMH